MPANPYLQLKREANFVQCELGEILAQLYALRNMLASTMTAAGHLRDVCTTARDAHDRGDFTDPGHDVIANKYTCPECGQNAWAKPKALLSCRKCSEPLFEELAADQA